MDKQMYEMLQKDLAKAIQEKDYAKIEQLKQILNISQEQASYFDTGLTGFPSIDQTWQRFYKEGASARANDIPLNKTVWDVIEEKLIEFYDIPAIEYFKRQISRADFIENVYTWARTFKAMGVEPDEIVPIYGPFFPDICAMTLALNVIGATPYFLKLAISPEALEEETREAKIAVVFDGMWKNVANEFSKDKFKKVLVATPTDAMPSPKKEIVSFVSFFQSLKDKSSIPKEKKYIWLDEAKQIANYYTGDVKEKFVANRNAFITSSSGTSINGIVKGTIATNESTIYHLQMGKESEISYFPGDRLLNNFPPTASTSLNVLFLYSLYHGLTMINDPRVSEKDFYNQIIKMKPNIALTTGSMWESFFNRVYSEMQQGKKFDFSYAKGWTIGGEGSDPQKFARWKQIMEMAHSKDSLFSGYGSSELFSGISVEKLNAFEFANNMRAVMNVGIPYAGLTVGVFDENGKELTYGQRGELWVKSNTAMKGYYNKPEVTSETLIDGWIHTGDLADIDENGFLYIWGRVKDKIVLPTGEDLYLFDVANKIKENENISDAIVLNMPTTDNIYNLVAHIVWNAETTEETKKTEIIKINQNVLSFIPEGISLNAYSEHKGMLPYSPTTLKKDKNGLLKQNSNYFQINGNEMIEIEFVPGENGIYSINYEIMSKEDVKTTLRR